VVRPLREHDHQQDRDGDDRGGGVHGAELAGDGRTRPTVVVPPPGTPSTAGSWCTTICTEIPARTPVTAGVERNSEIHPIRSRAHRRDQPSHQQRQHGHQLGVPVGPGNGDARDPGREDGGDGRIRADGQQPVAPGQREDQPPDDEGIQTDDGRHADQPCCRHLLGDRDGDEREIGQHIRPQPGPLAVPQRGRGSAP